MSKPVVFLISKSDWEQLLRLLLYLILCAFCSPFVAISSCYSNNNHLTLPVILSIPWLLPRHCIDSSSEYSRISDTHSVRFSLICRQGNAVEYLESSPGSSVVRLFSPRWDKFLSFIRRPQRDWVGGGRRYFMQKRDMLNQRSRED